MLNKKYATILALGKCGRGLKVRGVFNALLLSINLVACSGVPSYHEDRRVRPTEVVQRVQCELRMASERPSGQRLNLNTYSAGFTLSMKVETEIGPNASGDWVIPYHLTDTFIGGLKAGLTDYVLRDGSISYSVKIADLANFPCPDYLERAYRQDADTAEIVYGSFGVADWFDKMGTTLPATVYARPGKMDYTVKFGVTGSATASPGFKIVNLTGVVNLPAKRIDTHTLTMAFTQNPPPTAEPEPLEVCITNLPGAEKCKPEKKTPPSQGVLPSEKRPRPARGGVDPRTQQQLDQQLEMLRLRDILRQ